MDIRDLKNKICEENKIPLILEELGCKNIKNQNKYYTCSNPDGDNPQALQVYKNNMMIISYTRNIKSKFDSEYPDLIDYVNHYREEYFTKNIKWICDICGYDYYKSISEQQKPAPLVWLEKINKMKSQEDESEELSLEPIDEILLKNYIQLPNFKFKEDGISLKTQKEFEIGIDLKTHSISIPIRDELGTLVGVKARKLYNDFEMKYFYLEPFAKTQVLYGLNKTMPYIKLKKEVIVVESEKSVLKLWDYGIKNAVAISGHKFSKTQIKKILMLNCEEIIIALDKEIGLLNNNIIDKKYWKDVSSKFINGCNISIMIDRCDKLKEKESPADRKEMFYELYKGRVSVSNL